MDIGQAAAESGVSVKMIRHYESLGLLRKVARSHGNYRVFAPNDVHVLRFIKRGRALGFSVAEIKALLSLWQNRSRSSASVKQIAGRHMDELKAKIAEMNAMVDTLGHLVKHCHGDHRPDCPIIEELAASAEAEPLGEAKVGPRRFGRPGELPLRAKRSAAKILT